VGRCVERERGTERQREKEREVKGERERGREMEREGIIEIINKIKEEKVNRRNEKKVIRALLNMWVIGFGTTA
jgi:hypothetical protein